MLWSHTEINPYRDIAGCDGTVSVGYSGVLVNQVLLPPCRAPGRAVQDATQGWQAVLGKAVLGLTPVLCVLSALHPTR